jgi:acyl-CoA reductase-like NAD-dependent aldehyde dehydrogenase
MEFIPQVIDGEEAESVSGERFASVDPWTREPWAEVALGEPQTVLADRATGPSRPARRAFDEGPWPRLGFAERGALLHRFADLIEENADALALADTTDMGKPISDARGRTVLLLLGRAPWRTTGSSPATPASPPAKRCRWTLATTPIPGSSRPAWSPPSRRGTSR